MPVSFSSREKIAMFAVTGLGVALLWASLSARIPLGWSEILGFYTGAGCVFLVVKTSVWNFPIGLANNLFFGILFFQSRLYNDFGLQIVYFVLGAWGWWFWTHGGAQKYQLQVARAGTSVIAACLIFVPVLTLVLTQISIYFSGAAPFWDALTTALSLVAQFLLGRKWIQNWYFWILADLIYVPLYISRELYLTAALYAGFLILCVLGLRNWKRLELSSTKP